MELQRKEQEKLDSEQINAIEKFKKEEENRRKVNRRSFLSGTFVIKGMKPLNAEKDFVVKGFLPKTKINCN